MGDNTYKMENLVFGYRKLGHGKARAAAIRCAIEQADLNNDIPYMVFLREELCSESLWYLNGLDVITIFPEILALIDRYPDVSLTRFQKGEPDIIKPVLWLYEALLSVCSDFYQVSLQGYILINLNNAAVRNVTVNHHVPPIQIYVIIS